MAEKNKTESATASNTERVKIKIPLTKSEREDVTVYLNGKKFVIKRGYEVDVPIGVAEVIRNKEKMLAESFDYEANASKNFDE